LTIEIAGFEARFFAGGVNGAVVVAVVVTPGVTTLVVEVVVAAGVGVPGVVVVET
jgi:hypothetical protein